MHEFALAEAVVSAALREAEKAGIARIEAIEVSIGELQRIRCATFEFALKEVLPPDEPRLASAEMRLTIEPARFGCRACKREFGLQETDGPGDGTEAEAIHFLPELAHAYLRCPDCRSPDFELVQGRGVVLRRIEGQSE
jgi:hydrogenase nickel incorporation protein HypA/HybF